MPAGARCFRCRMERISAPVAVEFLLCLWLPMC